MMFTDAELNAMQETQKGHMMDTCVIYRVKSLTKNKYGEAVKTFYDGVESICGVEMQPLSKEYSDSFVEANIDAILRLPLGTVVVPGDEIEVTKRFGKAVTPQRYEVDRHTNDGPSGCRAYLKVRIIA